jgi:hypothetical protein
LEEWFGRIGLEGNEEVINLYGKVRYGDWNSTNDELQFVKLTVRELRNKLIAFKKK